MVLPQEPIEEEEQEEQEEEAEEQEEEAEEQEEQEEEAEEQEEEESPEDNRHLKSIAPAVGYLGTRKKTNKMASKPAAPPVVLTEEEKQRKKFGMGMIQSIATMKLLLAVRATHNHNRTVNPNPTAL